MKKKTRINFWIYYSIERNIAIDLEVDQERIILIGLAFGRCLAQKNNNLPNCLNQICNQQNRLCISNTNRSVRKTFTY